MPGCPLLVVRSKKRPRLDDANDAEGLQSTTQSNNLNNDGASSSTAIVIDSEYEDDDNKEKMRKARLARFGNNM